MNPERREQLKAEWRVALDKDSGQRAVEEAIARAFLPVYACDEVKPAEDLWNRIERSGAKRVPLIPNGHAKGPAMHSPLWIWIAAAAVVALVAVVATLAMLQNAQLAPPERKTVEQVPIPELPEAPDQVSQPELTRPKRPVVQKERGTVGEVLAMVGEPTVTLPGNPPKLLSAGDPVLGGSRIETNDYSKVEVRISDGSVVRLGFNSRLEVPEKGNRLILAHGSAWTVAAKQDPDEPLSIETPVATATVLGTEFGLDVDRNGDSSNDFRAVLRVREGSVQFGNRSGSITAGPLTESIVVGDTGPTQPRRIPYIRTIYVGRGVTFRETTRVLRFYESHDRLSAAFRDPGFVAVPFQGAAYVKNVAPGSPAARLGIEGGDRIVALEGRPFSLAGFADALSSGRDALTLTIERRGERSSFTVALADRAVRKPDGDRARSRELGRLVLAGRQREATARYGSLEGVVLQASARNDLGVAYEADDRMMDAIKRYASAVASEPSVSLYRFNLGLALRKIGNYRRSQEELQRAVAMDPGWPAAGIEYGRALAFVGDQEGARAHFDSLTKKWPGDPDVLSAAALEHLAAGDLESSLNLVNAARARNPNHPRALAASAAVLSVRGREETAMGWLERALDEDPYESENGAVLGGLYTRFNVHADSEQPLRRAYALDPTDTEVGLLLAACMRNLSRDAPTLREAQAVQSIVGGPLRRTYDQLEREADGILTSVEELHERSAATLIERYRLSRTNSNFTELVEQVLQAEPPNAWTTFTLSRMASPDDRELQIQLLETSVSLDPEFTEPYRDLALIHARAGDRDRALEVLDSLLAMSPNDTRIVGAVASLLDQHGFLEDAIRLAEYEVDNSWPLALQASSLASLYERRGDMASAYKYHRRALLCVGTVKGEAAKVLADLIRLNGDPRILSAAARGEIEVLPTDRLRGLLDSAEREAGMRDLDAYTRHIVRAEFEAQPHDAWIALVHALRLMSQGEPAQAIALLVRVFDSAQTRQAVAAALADAYGSLGDSRNEAAWTLRHLELLPMEINNYARASIMRKVTRDQLESGDPYVALACERLSWSRFRTAWPKVMVECLFRIERFEEAERVLRESLPLAIPSGNQSYRLPDVAVQYALLGRSQEAQGKSGEALASYRRSLEIDPNNRESRAGVARLGGTFSID